MMTAIEAAEALRELGMTTFMQSFEDAAFIGYRGLFGSLDAALYTRGRSKVLYTRDGLTEVMEGTLEEAVEHYENMFLKVFRKSRTRHNPAKWRLIAEPKPQRVKAREFEAIVEAMRSATEGDYLYEAPSHLLIFYQSVSGKNGYRELQLEAREEREPLYTVRLEAGQGGKKIHDSVQYRGTDGPTALTTYLKTYVLLSGSSENLKLMTWLGQGE